MTASAVTLGSSSPVSHARKGRLATSSFCTLVTRRSAPKRSACSRMWAMSSGPVMPVGKPGKFSMSVVSMSWPPGWSVVEDGSPSITSGRSRARAV